MSHLKEIGATEVVTEKFSSSHRMSQLLEVCPLIILFSCQISYYDNVSPLEIWQALSRFQQCWREECHQSHEASEVS